MQNNLVDERHLSYNNDLLIECCTTFDTAYKKNTHTCSIFISFDCLFGSETPKARFFLLDDLRKKNFRFRVEGGGGGGGEIFF